MKALLTSLVCVLLMAVIAGPSPVILAQPVSVTVAEGEQASFSVSASGSDLRYQWQYSPDGAVWKNNSFKTESMALTAKAGQSGYQFRCVVRSGDSLVISDPATMTVLGAKPVITVPVITSQPVSVTVKEGQTASFGVKADGDNLTWQWEYSRDGGLTWKVNSITSDSMSLVGKFTQSGYQFRCVVTNEFGSVTSDPAVMTVVSAAPVITAQPESVTVTEEKKASFAVKAEGDDLAYQWQYSRDGVIWNDNSTVSDTMAFSVKLSQSGYQFRCVVTNEFGSVTSDPAVLTVVSAAPVITAQPGNVTAAEGAQVSFSVEAAGEDLSYQWQFSRDGGASWNDNSATGMGMEMTARKNLTGYLFRCVVTNEYGTATSDPAVLTVE